MQFAEKQLLSNLVQTLDLQKNKDKLNDEIYLSGNFDLECVDCLLFPHHSLIKILTHHIQRDSSPNIDFVPNAFRLGHSPRFSPDIKICGTYRPFIYYKYIINI